MSRWLQETQLGLSKKILIRADASNTIGTGHVMRCLTLANEAKQRGWRSCIVLREPDRNMVDFIASFNHEVKELMSITQGENKSVNSTSHCDWLSVSQAQDAQETLDVIYDFKPDWIIVDHYALDASWLAIVKQSRARILVIDDLGDRQLICDLLLDQNLGACARKYDGKVPKNCTLLMGPRFALLRNEFKEWRERSLRSRLDRNIKKVLITMGGSDADNFTLKVLNELTKSKNGKKCEFIVIIGGSYISVESFHEFIKSSEMNVSVFYNVNNMAEIMSEADLCIGAAGSTSWERCCLGLPTINISIAKNQEEIVEQLSKRDVSIHSNINNLRNDFEQFFNAAGRDLQRNLSVNSRRICDGLGVSRVFEELEKNI